MLSSPGVVGLLVSEPERGSLSLAIQMLKTTDAPNCGHAAQTHAFLAHSVRLQHAHFEKTGLKLRYMHRNPSCAAGWRSRRSSAIEVSDTHQTGGGRVVEIESQWTGLNTREQGFDFW